MKIKIDQRDIRQMALMVFHKSGCLLASVKDNPSRECRLIYELSVQDKFLVALAKETEKLVNKKLARTLVE